MSELTLTKTRFTGGIWEGVVTGGAGPLEVVLDAEPVQGVTLEALPEGGRLLRVPVPAEAIGDGIRCFVIRSSADGAVLGQFAVIGGELADAALVSEVALLRAELDLLKRAFRRHCSETG